MFNRNKGTSAPSDRGTDVRILTVFTVLFDNCLLKQLVRLHPFHTILIVPIHTHESKYGTAYRRSGNFAASLAGMGRKSTVLL